MVSWFVNVSASKDKLKYCTVVATRNVTRKAKPRSINAPIIVHLRLWVSFHIVRLVVAQGLCSIENSIRLEKYFNLSYHQRLIDL